MLGWLLLTLPLMPEMAPYLVKRSALTKLPGSLGPFLNTSDPGPCMAACFLLAAEYLGLTPAEETPEKRCWLSRDLCWWL